MLEIVIRVIRFDPYKDDSATFEYLLAGKKKPASLEAGFQTLNRYAGSSMYESGGVGMGSDRL